MRFSSILVLAVVAATTLSLADVPPADVPPADVPSADVPSADVPSADPSPGATPPSPSAEADLPVRLEIEAVGGFRPLAGALVEAGTHTLRLSITAPGFAVVSAVLDPIAPSPANDQDPNDQGMAPDEIVRDDALALQPPAPVVDLTAQLARARHGEASSARIELALGTHVLIVRLRREKAGGEPIAGEPILAEAGFLSVPAGGESFFSSVRREMVVDPETELRFEASTLLVSFAPGTGASEASKWLSAMGLAPEDWFGELALVRARIPGGRDPMVVGRALASRFGASSMSRSAMSIVPNLALEDEAVLGERMPKRLVAAYQARGDGDCDRAGTALRGCFDRGTASADPLRGFRYHFLYDTFAGHRLVEHILSGVANPQRIGIAIVDGGFGRGGVNPSNIPNGDLFGFSAPPFFARRGGGLVRRIRPLRAAPANLAGRQECRANPRAPWAACGFTLADVSDRSSSHGTRVAVTAAGRPTPHLRRRQDRSLLGTGPRARLRILKRSGRATAFDSIVPVYAAAIDPRVQVINTSFGTRLRRTPPAWVSTNIGGVLRNVVRLVRDRGKIWVTSAGNDGRCTDPTSAARPCGANARGHFPSDFAPGPGPRTAADFTVLAVGNAETAERLTGPEQLRSSSNYGPRVSVVAGGGSLVVSGRDGSLGIASGTSFSAPAVAGLAAEMLHLNRNMAGVPAFSALRIIELIEATADDLGSIRDRPTFRNDQPANGRDIAFGHGRINVWKALLAVANGGIDGARMENGANAFPSLPVVPITDDTWFGFSVQSPVHDATLWLDAQPVRDPLAVRPTGGGAATRDLTAYKGVESSRVIQRGLDPNGDGVPDEDPTSGIVPVGTAAGEYLATFSAQRRDLRCAGRPCTLSLRRPGQSAADLPFFSVRLELDSMRAGRVPGVVYDDFVFEITGGDFGDAPPPYPSRLLADDGARSLNASLEWLGVHPRAEVTESFDAVGGVSREPDAIGEAGGPDARVDPDGVTNIARKSGRDGMDHGVMFFPRTYEPGKTGRVEFTVCVAQIGRRYRDRDDSSLWVNGWIDWNTDGRFEEANGEHVVDGLGIVPGVRWRVRGARARPVSQAGNCATFERSFAVPAAIGRGALWSRFRVDYGENAGRNDPRPGRRSARRNWRSDPSLRDPSLAPSSRDTGGEGLATGASRFGEVEDYLLGTDYGDALDRLPPARGGGPNPDYPTRDANQGAYSLAFAREWLGGDADEARASREIDACDRPMDPAEEDARPNLDRACLGRNLDAEDLGVTLPAVVAPGQRINLGITVASQIDLRGFSNRGPGGPVGADSAGVLTLKPNCRLGPIADLPDTPERFRQLGRYAAFGTGRQRLFLSAWADWNADGDWDDPGETVLAAQPVDPEDFGKDGVYTLGEPFDDRNGDSVFTDGVDRFVPARHDVAGITSRSFQCPVQVPANVAQGKEYFWRVRLAYGEGPAAVEANALRGVVHHAELVPGQNRGLAGPLGGSFWGEVEDHPQTAGCVEHDRYQHSRLELRLRLAGGGEETVTLEGPTAWKVKVCDLRDRDGDGLEEVTAHIAHWDMHGTSEHWGPMSARLAPVHGNGRGMIEERVNRSPGVLDLPPFAEKGTATGSFTLAFDLALGDRHYRVPLLAMYEEITFKPPKRWDERFESVEPVRLLGPSGEPTGIEVLGLVYIPMGGKEASATD